MMKRLALVFSVLLVLCLVTTHCAPVPTPEVIKEVVKETVVVTKEVVVTATPEPEAKPQAGGTLIFGKAREAVGLDPHLVTARSSFEITRQTYNQLIDLGDDYAPIPELAESWENPDDTTFIFHLRQGVKFHNGRELVAADVKYSFERITNPDVGSPWATQLELIDACCVQGVSGLPS